MSPRLNARHLKAKGQHKENQGCREGCGQVETIPPLFLRRPLIQIRPPEAGGRRMAGAISNGSYRHGCLIHFYPEMRDETR
ncbi:hypothetical protein CBR_g19484 [Chara braunii]|uniref:Uncharacterized protein n=1 Tax=Chara braunii TaxID=69332 RepID=A0A388KY63_CHABU|nr:hypothetical protein CBR_g19484 [Chara braunii]|eukprot:GBG74971.1 hypothetical protein CBR_g19484 [Chara braunii]